MAMKNLVILAVIVASHGLCTSLTAEEKPFKVFLLAGQSNMVGARSKVEELPDELKDVTKDAEAWRWNKWVPLDPSKTQRSGFGPEISFSRRLSQHFGEPIGIIKLSVGGSSLAEDWSPDRPKSLYHVLLEQVRRAKKQRKIEIVGMLWMQGGRDARFEPMAKAYAENLPKFIARLRKDLNRPDMIFIAGLALDLPKETFPHEPLVRQAQNECQAPRYTVISTEGIKKGPDNMHFNTEGQVELGRRFADAMILMMKEDAAKQQ